METCKMEEKIYIIDFGDEFDQTVDIKAKTYEEAIEKAKNYLIEIIEKSKPSVCII